MTIKNAQHKLGEVVEVVETREAAEANRLMDAGWIMMTVGTGNELNGSVVVLYSLGRVEPWRPGRPELTPIAIPDGTTSADQLAMLAQWISDNAPGQIGPGGAVENAIRIMVEADALGRRVEDLVNWFEVEFPEDAKGPNGLFDVKIVLQRLQAQTRDRGVCEALIPADRIEEIEAALDMVLNDNQIEDLSRLRR